MPGVTVGKNCVIGCGAVVTKDIPEGMVAIGVPARPIETIEEYCRHHKDEFVHTKKMTPAEKKAFLLKQIPR